MKLNFDQGLFLKNAAIACGVISTALLTVAGISYFSENDDDTTKNCSLRTEKMDNDCSPGRPFER